MFKKKKSKLRSRINNCHMNNGTRVRRITNIKLVTTCRHDARRTERVISLSRVRVVGLGNAYASIDGASYDGKQRRATQRKRERCEQRATTLSWRRLRTNERLTDSSSSSRRPWWGWIDERERSGEARNTQKHGACALRCVSRVCCVHMRRAGVRVFGAMWNYPNKEKTSRGSL